MCVRVSLKRSQREDSGRETTIYKAGEMRENRVEMSRYAKHLNGRDDPFGHLGHFQCHLYQ